jgi:hypothetical protein
MSSWRSGAPSLAESSLEEVEQLEAPVQSDLEVVNWAPTPPAYSSMSFWRRIMNILGRMYSGLTSTWVVLSLCSAKLTRGA